ncbi:intron maturase, type II family protein [Tasmannia lanceolata]|uniref:intron maturase, type II family protein n=1 Tax=Tasmannia lanceolata TaxID=3420 RepID=UPI0040644693
MWFVGFLTSPRRHLLNHMVYMLRNVNLVVISSTVNKGKYLERMQLYSIHSTLGAVRDINKDVNHAHKDEVSSMSLAKSLACLPDESPLPTETKPRTRMELKRSIEIHIKRRVKEQYTNGKFHNLLEKVIANPRTLQDAYDVIRLNSNIELTSECDDLCFTSMAEQLARGGFDIKANTLTISTKNRRSEALVLPNLKLKVIQEAIRIVLEVVYRPHFSKISHGCRSGRGHHSAIKYLCKEIHKPNWWFTLRMNKGVDASVLNKLILEMEEYIIDTGLYSILRHMLDAQVLNLEFGGFPKGQGLPQEGVLSPILMNIYLDLFDREFYRIRMRYEGLGLDPHSVQGQQQSKLRHWFRRQMEDDKEHVEENSGLRLHACRYMDEIFIAIAGTKDVALNLKVEIQNYLKNSLYLDVDDQTEILAIDSAWGVQFLGMVFQASVKENGSVRSVHKLKDKVRLFAMQKKELWDAGTVRMGKKWLAHGLKKVKESEIKQLADSNSVLNQISHYRKDGMKTDHWFKFLLKIWMQDVNARAENNEEEVLCKYIAEPALPKDLTDSFYNFQKQAKEYVSSETAATNALLSNSSIGMSSSSSTGNTTTKVVVPVNFIKKSLLRYGLINKDGFPWRVSTLVLQDDIHIIHWFLGLSRRWLRWYHQCDNFEDVKLMIVEYVRKSCIRTLATKHRMWEAEIERRFELELSGIPSTQEMESDMMLSALDFQLSSEDEALTYGISYSGICMLSLAWLKDPSESCQCYVVGCLASAPGIYTLYVNERQKFPGWKTGFSTAIHPSLNRRRIGLCKKHVEDLYLGHISLQSIDFGASNR